MNPDEAIIVAVGSGVQPAIMSGGWDLGYWILSSYNVLGAGSEELAEYLREGNQLALHSSNPIPYSQELKIRKTQGCWKGHNEFDVISS